MGIDHGLARLGVSISDPLGVVARPLTIIRRRSKREDFDILSDIIREHHIVLVVVGLPTGSDGEISQQAAKVIRWCRALSETISIPVVLWDESYSTVSANALLAKRTSARRLPHIDDLAATVILQDYLTARGEQNEPGKPLEAYTSIS